MIDLKSLTLEQIKALEPNGQGTFDIVLGERWERSRMVVREFTGDIVAFSSQRLVQLLREDNKLDVINMGNGTFYVGNAFFEIIFPYPDYNYWHDAVLCQVSWRANPLWMK